MGLREGLKRTVRELPEREAEANRVGIAYVSVLFSIVVGTIAEGAVAPFRALGDTSVPWDHPWATLSHYLVALVLTVTSYVGYFSSKHGPQLRIKFFNLPFVLIVLDSTMVVLYFFTAVYAEGDKARPDPRPEAVLLTLSFGLYFLWDLVGFVLQRDPYSQLALGRHPRNTYGARRWVTIGSMAGAAMAMLVALTVPSRRWRTSDVIWFDLVLVAILLLYRVAKSMCDGSIPYRGSTAEPAFVRRDGEEVPDTDWVKLVPATVRNDRAVLELFSRSTAATNVEEKYAAAVERLRGAGAIEMCNQNEEECARLTSAGWAYLQRVPPQPSTILPATGTPTA